MIRVKIPTPWESQVAKAMFYLTVDEAGFIEKYMALLAGDLYFPCQPALKVANVAFEDGEIWADVDVSTLPKYKQMKSYDRINEAFFELVAECIHGAKAVNDMTVNVDADIINKDNKAVWSSEFISGYLLAIIRMVQSKGSDYLLPKNAVCNRYIDDMIADKESPILARDSAIALAEKYTDLEGFHSIGSRHTEEVSHIWQELAPDLKQNLSISSGIQQRLDTLKTKHRLNQDLLAVIGQAIHKAQKEAVLAAADQ